MLPLIHNILCLEEIAEYWSREIKSIRPMAEIHDELLSAFWHNKLTVFVSIGEESVDRRGLLKLVRLKSEHPGFTVVDNAEMIPPPTEEHADGRITIDATRYIVIPSDEVDWTDQIIEAAYSKLATMSFEDFHELLKPGLRSLGTTREALAAYCDLIGYSLPQFWFRAMKPPVSFGGRPSVMRQILAEMNRRAERHALAPTLRDEVNALLIWAKNTIDDKIQLPNQRATENALRAEYNKFKKLRPAVTVDEH